MSCKHNDDANISGQAMLQRSFVQHMLLSSWNGQAMCSPGYDRPKGQAIKMLSSSWLKIMILTGGMVLYPGDPALVVCLLACLLGCLVAWLVRRVA